MQLYVDLLKKVLTDYHRVEWSEYRPVGRNNPGWKARLALLANRATCKSTQHRTRPLALCEKITFDPAIRAIGRDWPTHAETPSSISTDGAFTGERPDASSATRRRLSGS
ncbi:MAG: hypothetical protein ABI399_07905 [Bauldia sp.]